MRYYLWALVLLAWIAGCTENNNITAKDKVEITVANPKNIPLLVEVPPDQTLVRLWLSDEGYFVFDGESYFSGNGKESRRTIQSAVEEKFPTYRIGRLLEQRNGDTIIYFAYIKPKPGVND